MYETLAKFAQTWGLLLFVLAFVLVLIYALNPRNKKKFDEAKRIPLEDEEDGNGGKRD
ncbi:cbb3-type cytochrome c oxidase subunit 3 [Hyphococcus luteus]|uniref:CcoQ/FixQ family Cbb3-type cytochrome c oxidase assembly chaperone n=1 Tax=Hyphococcus luteus TaxID=2058213 RepID=A0A2S7K8R2_9PROT|nr:cbb3-type cytochrome c oxidase subunit 3 [Marinicaulis flavus]PQA88882.1 CcoQ/FixQ family Cbb3-type cytochrome c oxidase assembly chaperone [Marinicaulis flavus]